MLLEKVMNTLRGQVRVHVESGFPERVLNLCGARKLSFWDLHWESPTSFSCTLSRRDYLSLRRAVKKLDCTLQVERRQGVPFFLGRMKRRQALTCGLIACCVALFFCSFFIWDFRIEGNETVSDQEILRALEKNGITLGTFGFSVDGEDLRNHVLLEIPELSWITVNVFGCQARVQVRERVPAPEMVDKRKTSNLVARRDGLILRVEALAGKKLVLPGTTVEEGQLLISGVEDTDTFGARLTAGLGKVYARTWYTLSANMPLSVERKVYADRDHRRFSLIFGTHRVKFYGNGSYFPDSCDKIQNRTQLRLFGLALPVTVEEETYRPYTTQTEAVSPVAAEREGKEILTAYLHSLLDEEGSVNSTLCSSRQRGDVLTVTLTAECEEQIGRSVPVYVEGQEDAEDR